MRYWHPFAAEAARAVKAWGAERVLLLPLYPQYSTTTTRSSFADWDRAAAKAGIRVPTRAICCFPEESGLVAAAADLHAETLRAVPAGMKRRILFSAHGLPKKIVASGDPY